MVVRASLELVVEEMRNDYPLPSLVMSRERKHDHGAESNPCQRELHPQATYADVVFNRISSGSNEASIRRTRTPRERRLTRTRVSESGF